QDLHSFPSRRSSDLVMDCTMYSNAEHWCCWSVLATVKMRSTNRQPASLLQPNERFRHSTALRNARSAALLVGSTPCSRANVHSADRKSTRLNSSHVS